MSVRFRLLAGCASIVLVVCLNTGCRDDIEPRPKSGPAGARTEIGDKGGADTVTDGGAPGGAARLEDVASVPEGVDDQDDSSAPDFLPRSSAVAGWVKHEPVRVGGVSVLAEVLSASEAARFGHFKIESVARCAYALHEVGGTVVARVVTIETDGPEDAYGLVTCASGSLETESIGGLDRVDEGGGLVFHAWKGRVYVRLSCESGGAEIGERARRLLRHIVARILRENVPPIVEAMPTESARPGELWLVRHLASLRSVDLVRVASPEADTVSRLLGLNGEALMCIGTYDVPGGRRPNVVWLVRYPTDEAAAEAHGRYQRYLNEARERAAQSTNLLDPRGRFLVGTWTSEEESLQYMMPRIAQLLPS